VAGNDEARLLTAGNPLLASTHPSDDA